MSGDKFKAARFVILDEERYFVIPIDEQIEKLVWADSRKISDVIVAVTSTWPKALKIAMALNHYEHR